MISTLETATELLDQGVACIPVNDDKRPRIQWRQYMDEMPTREALDGFFSNGAALAIVAGEVQCLDVDCKHQLGIWGDYRQRCEEFGLKETLDKCVLQRTPSGGYHVVFRCRAPLRNLKLAKNEDKEVILETRGQGGYFLAHPSKGYELLKGSLSDLPTLTEDERDDLLATARSFDAKPKERAQPIGGNETPGDAFDARADVELPLLLIRHGWTQSGQSKYWTRPGKKNGVSASWGHIEGRFWVFTTSTDFEAEHLYRPWHVYAVLEHGGDFKRAASELARLGYGERREKAEAPSTRLDALDQVEKAVSSEPKPVLPSFELPPILHIEEEEFQDWKTPPELVKGVLYQGAKLMLAGPSKSRKTFVLSDLAMSVGSGMPWLGFPTTQTPVLYLNFELQQFASRNRKRDIQKSKFSTVEPEVYFWHLRGALSKRGFSPHAIYNHITAKLESFCLEKGIGLIIIDPVYRLMQLAGEENKAEDVGKLLNELEAISTNTGACVAFAHHFAKGNASSKDAADRASGSGVFARDPDALLTMTPHEEEDCMVIEGTLRNFMAPEPFVVRWDYPVWERAIDLDPSQLKQVKRARGGRPKVELSKIDIAAVLSRFEGQITRSNEKEVAAALGCGVRTAWKKCKEAMT